MLEHEKVIMKRQFTKQTITVQHALTHTKLQYDLSHHLEKRRSHQKPQEGVSQKIFLQQTDYVTEWIRISIWKMTRKLAWKSIILFILTHSVQNTTYVTIHSLIATTSTDIECLLHH